MVIYIFQDTLLTNSIFYLHVKRIPEFAMRNLVQHFNVRYTYPVFFERDVFQSGQQLLASLLEQAGPKQHKVLVFIDSGVVNATPALCKRISTYAEANREVFELCEPIHVLTGGEGCKNRVSVIDTVIEAIRINHICRHSFLLAIGGGAVLDAVGFAGAIAHRGIRLIRFPTTVLAQNDAGVGVKNGINAMGRKNFLGTFAPPYAVINDSVFLDTLYPRDRRSGIAEAVKMALIKDRTFFDFLYARRHDLALFERHAEAEMIYRCAVLHMDHIASAGDPFEMGSARPLDFGHWSAHKLEEMTNGGLCHGEAVAIGMALDSLYSQHAGLITKSELLQIFSLLEDLALPLYHPALTKLDIPVALFEFQEHLGGELCITLLSSIGCGEEVYWIDTELMMLCIDELERQFGTKRRSSMEQGRNRVGC